MVKYLILNKKEMPESFWNVEFSFAWPMIYGLDAFLQIKNHKLKFNIGMLSLYFEIWFKIPFWGENGQ